MQCEAWQVSENNDKVFMEKETEIRFQCMECNSTIPKKSRKCCKCGSYDIDIKV